MIDIQGLYDSVKCEYPLPLPDDVDKNEMPDWSEFSFQTQSFMSNCSTESEFFEVNSFNIDEEGEIYRDVVEREYDETEDGYMDLIETHKGIEKVDWMEQLYPRNSLENMKNIRAFFNPENLLNPGFLVNSFK